MSKITLRLLSSIFLFTVFIISCSKDKGDKPKSKTTLLTQTDWLVSKFEEKLNNGPYVDDVPNWQTCDKDDKYVFKTNNAYEYNEGATKCDASDPQIIQIGLWSLTDNETKLQIDTQSFTIDQLDDNTMILSTTQVLGPDTFYLKITFIH